MFEKIRELIEDPEALVCILMDEVRMHSIPLRVILPCVTVCVYTQVESLTAVRRASANEPSDAIRVVNALLTQIDQIKVCSRRHCCR